MFECQLLALIAYKCNCVILQVCPGKEVKQYHQVREQYRDQTKIKRKPEYSLGKFIKSDVTPPPASQVLVLLKPMNISNISCLS